MDQIFMTQMCLCIPKKVLGGTSYNPHHTMNWCRRLQPTVGGTIPRWAGLDYKKAREQTSKQHSSMVSPSVSLELLDLTWLNDSLCPGSIILIYPFLSKLFLVKVFYYSNMNQMRTLPDDYSNCHVIAFVWETPSQNHLAGTHWHCVR